MTRIQVALALAMLVSASAARAQTYVDEARELMAELAYESAYETLLEGVSAGESGPADMRVAFQLLGELAASLGDGESARDYFARLLALEPEFELPEGTSPKIGRWLEAARESRPNARPLSVEHEIDSARIVLVVRGDPVGMVAGASAAIRTDSGTQRVHTRAPQLDLPLPDAPRVEVELSLVDAYGNRLLDLVEPIVVERPAKVERPLEPDPAPTAARQPAPLHTRWYTYGAVSAGAGVAGGLFALRAYRAQRRFDRLVADSEQHEAADALATERRLRRSTLYANISFGAAVAAGAAAAVVAVAFHGDSERAAPRAALAPTATPHGGGLSFAIVF